MKLEKKSKINPEEFVVLSIRIRKKYLDKLDLHVGKMEPKSGAKLKRSDAARELLIEAIENIYNVK